MTVSTNSPLAFVGTLAGIALLSGCASNPRFPTLAATDSYYRILVRDQLYHGDSIAFQGDWLVVEAWPRTSNKRPASADANQLVWIPRVAVTTITSVQNRD